LKKKREEIREGGRKDHDQSRPRLLMLMRLPASVGIELKRGDLDLAEEIEGQVPAGPSL
jgi:hypothetical protein